MRLIASNQISFRSLLLALAALAVVSSCTVVKKYPKNKPFIFKNIIEIRGGNFTTNDRAALKQRLNNQLADSSRVKIVDKYFIRHVYTKPPAYDTASSNQSARNMKGSMLHLGYYHANVTYTQDTAKVGSQRRVHVHYVVETGPPTLIDTVSYILRKPDIEALATQSMDKALLKENEPVTKSAVIGEIGRLVDLYRNNGYYKFTTEELKVRGDTATEALTNISTDIFEQLRLLELAQKAKDSPTIRLAVVLNTPSDSTRLKKYRIGNIYILPDYQPGDQLTDPALTTVRTTRYINGKKCDTCPVSYIVKYHRRLFRIGFLMRNIRFRTGELYAQDNYYETINKYTKAGVWQSVMILMVDRKDNSDSVDIVVQLIPGKKHGIEASIETSYSANSNTNSATVSSAGNLFGISGNLSWLDRNVHREAIRMTNSLRAGIELNLAPDSSNKKNVVNSNEFTYSNNILIPRFIYPFSKLNSKRNIASETFFNTNLSYIRRFGLFDLQSYAFNAGFDWTKKAVRPNRPNRQWVWKPVNFEFNRLYNKTEIFDSTLDANPFLRYSFNTALVAGFGIGSIRYSFIHVNPKHTNRQYSFTGNFEESGLFLGFTSVLKKYLRNFVKADVEYVFSTTRKKSEVITRVFAGVGVPIRKDTSLPFFKQYFGGGSNSMRAWPIRGIGRGNQPLAPFGKSNSFNDRTGDIQLEANVEYRYDIAALIPNSLILKGAVFMDVGNIWNFKNANPGGGTDSTQFKFQNLYKQLGVALGTGFRLDFNYFVLRLDMGFRVKRPDISKNAGWQIPNITFNNLFRRGEQVPDPNNPGQTVSDERYRKWRYENFNFTIGISYPF